MVNIMKNRPFIFLLSLFILSTLLIFSYSLMGKAQGREKRTALLIGNSRYKDVPLKNPVNDAKDMAAVLRAKGFDVTVITDANQRKIENAIRRFGKKLNQGGIGLFYYAGHGIQVNGRNYLVPVDSNIESEDEVKYKAVDAGFVLGKMENAENMMNIVILDACRDNPFARSFRSMSRGLAFMDAPRGTLIVYATSPGATAADGDGRNGLFTKHLMDLVKNSNMEIGPLLREVRKRVLLETEGKQQPWEATSFTGEFYFSRTPPRVTPKQTRILPPKVQKVDLSDIQAQASRAAGEKKRWDTWQERLEADVSKVNLIDENLDVTRESKRIAWERLLKVYGNVNNPYSIKDDDLLKRIRTRVEFWSKKPGYGYLKVDAYPFAELILDGKNLGEIPPPKRLKLEEGKHEVMLKKGGQVFRKNVYIKVDQTENVLHSFKKKGA